jgi:signal transduction histidine kinase
MDMFHHIRNLLNQFVDVSVADPDDKRRRQLFNIIISSIAVLSLFLLLATTVVSLLIPNMAEINYIYFTGVIILGATLSFYLINRIKTIPGWITSGLFLLFLTTAITFSDIPKEVSGGRTLFVFTIPIIMASVLLTPASSFIFGGLSSLIISVIAISINEPPNTPAIAGYLVIALVAWLSSRSLEQALKELRQINIELDHRVEDRTRELSEALTREMAEAGKNQAILEGIADGVIVFDTQGKSIVANPALSFLLEKSPASLLDAPMQNLLQEGKIAPLDRETILAMLHDPQKDMPSVRFRWGERTLLVNAAPVIAGLGETIGTVAVFRDFTREAEVEQMKNTFVAMVSHELRTPLNAILGYAEMMREAVYGVLNGRQSGVVERIESSSKRLLSMVSDLLDQAQLEAGRMKIFESNFMTSDLTDAVHSMMDKEFKDKGLTLKVDLDPAMPTSMRGDVHRLQQILLNLVSNAVKFTEAGSVDVRIFHSDPDSWGMEVVDTGPGIPPEAQQYVFESFRQADNVTTRKHGGIGLGLAIVRNLVQVLGGKITLTSKVDEGSTFTVILPFLHSKEEK